MSDEVIRRLRRPLVNAGRSVLAVCCLVLPPITSFAQPANTSASPVAKAPSSGHWASLTPSQKQALGPLEREWPGIDAPRRAKWLEIAAKFPQMPADEQGRVQDRMKEWARMTPAERGRARLSYQGARQLPPQERQLQWDAYQALPEVERRALASSASSPGAGTTSQVSRQVTASSPSKSAGPSVGQGLQAKPLPKAAQPVAPTLIQGSPGATTTPISRAATPPAHQLPGQPRIAAAPGQVDRTTLLPRKAAAGASEAASPGPAAPAKKSP